MSGLTPDQPRWMLRFFMQSRRVRLKQPSNEPSKIHQSIVTEGHVFLDPNYFFQGKIMSYGSKRGRRRRTKQLIILRGLPGTGKSELASELEGNSGIICSSDDYFRSNGKIVNFDPKELPRAHRENREKALDAIKEGYDPVIIDNTNMACWEMYPYVLMGFKRGYFVKFTELPDRNMTPQMDLEDLYRRCKGKVPMEKLRRMQNSYECVRSIFQILDDEVSLDKWSNHPENERNDWGNKE